jgi:hypothetical protein
LKCSKEKKKLSPERYNLEAQVFEVETSGISEDLDPKTQASILKQAGLKK